MEETLAKGFLAGTALGLSGIIFEEANAGLANGLYTVGGLLMYLFGIWLAIRVLTVKNGK